MSEIEALSSLSNREQEIASLVRSGLRNKAIAKQLSVSEGTVKQHVHNVFMKLGVHKRYELIVFLKTREG